MVVPKGHKFGPRKMLHGATEGGKRSPEYRSWSSMLDRCCNPRVSNYADYGGRGIKICDRWKSSFADFLADMGPRPSAQHSLDRIDNDGDYEPGNCRWATRREQNSNQRRNVKLTHDGETLTCREWARRLAVSASSLHRRLAKGWSVERVLTQPFQDRGYRATKKARQQPGEMKNAG